MTDRLTPDQRSFCMSRIKSKWTSPELKVHNWLKANKIRHTMHPNISGSPDLILKDEKVAVFINGCFWHGCKECYKEPETNVNFWKNKILKNVERDRKNKMTLEKKGWKTITIWGHEINKNFSEATKKLRRRI